MTEENLDGPSTRCLSRSYSGSTFRDGNGEFLAMCFADEARNHILAMTGVTEQTPFWPEVLVYKMGGKMFATLRMDDEMARMNLKCDPDRAVELREEHEGILPGYHINKKHWNNLVLDDSLQGSLVVELIEHSYELVVAGLSRTVREELGR